MTKPVCGILIDINYRRFRNGRSEGVNGATIRVEESERGRNNNYYRPPRNAKKRMIVDFGHQVLHCHSRMRFIFGNQRYYREVFGLFE